MNAQNSICPNCGKRLTSGALMGLCPDCLLNTGFESLAGRVPNARTFVPPDPAAVERHFPQLQVIELIGQGGMGAVYKARQQQIDRIVALKILRANPKGDPEFAARFEREARALAKFHHPNIVTLYEFGKADGQYYLLMEYVDGVNLRQLLDSRHISPKEALAIVPQICDALQYAHDRGVVHRDIKPENILIDRRGVVKIADFGVAKILGGPVVESVSKLVGTPRYMAPEQILHPLKVDNRADIYALGVVFYQMLTGDLPTGKFEPPSRKMFVDVRLDEVVLRALEKKPEQRYQQVSALKTRIETLVSEVRAEPRTQRRWPVGAPLGAVAILGCLAAGLWVFGNMGSEVESGKAVAGADGSPMFVSLDPAREVAKPAGEAKIAEKPEAANPEAPVGAVVTTGRPGATKSDIEAIAEALKQLNGVTNVGTVSVDELAEGGVATGVSDAKDPHRVEIDSVFVVRASISTIERLFPYWNPAGPRTNVVRHNSSSKPDFRSFVALAYTDAAESMKALAKATEEIPSSQNRLNLSQEELARYRSGTPDGTILPPHVRDFWLNVLEKREAAFDSPQLSIPEYKKEAGIIDVKSEMEEWVDPKFSRSDSWQFPESQYWELIKTSEKRPSGALVLGARYFTRESSALTVTRDLQYYVSGGYYACLSKQRIAQFSDGENSAVLIWQRDSFLVPQPLDEVDYGSLPALERARILNSRSELKPSPAARDFVMSTAKAKVKAFKKMMEHAAKMKRPAPSIVPKTNAESR